MRKIMNRPETAVMEMCGGIANAHPARSGDPRSVRRKRAQAIRRSCLFRISQRCFRRPWPAYRLRASDPSGAVVGDKTLIDALAPCADEWSACAAEDCDLAASFARAAKKAAEGAAATAEHAARMGRAGAVGERSIGYPDAGAYALGQIFTELSEIIEQETMA